MLPGDDRELRLPNGTRILLAFDMTGFGDPRRDDQTRAYLRRHFYELVDTSFRGAGIDSRACYVEDRGDGAIVVLPAGTPLASVLETLIAELRAGIYRHNRVSAEIARLRIRLAVHIGELDHDGHGLVGTDVNHVFRLLEAAPVKQAMRPSGTYLALVVSDRVYEGVIRGGDGALVPEDYAPIRVRLKETDTPAWLRVPGSAPGAPAETAVLLPRDVPAFTGRGDLLGRLDGLADEHRGSSCVALLVGMPGAGKTAVAVHWAHRAADRFPGGRIHVDLGACSAHPMRPDDALAQILREIGGERPHIPAETRERVRLWRSWTAARKVLLVLDDVADSEQVRPLLAYGPGCMTLITGRSTPEALVAVSGAVPIDVPVLPPGDAVTLVRTIIGADRADREPGAVQALAERCAGLPIALRIAAAKIAVRPRRAIAGLANELLGSRRLAALRSADSPTVAVASVFDASYTGLPADACRVLRLIGLVPGPTFTAEAVSRLLGVPEESAGPPLDTLERAHLVEPVDTARYRVHALLLEYCRVRLAAEESADDRAAAFGALLDGYVAAAAFHRHRLGRLGRRSASEGAGASGEVDAVARRAALDWFAGEWQNLAAAARAAHDDGRWEVTGRLADALSDVLLLSRHIHENIEVQRLAVHAAKRQGDGPLQVLSLQRLARCQRELGEYPAALDHADRALALAAQLGEQALGSESRRILGSIRWRLGQYDAALEETRSALRLARACGDARAEASALSLLAKIERRRGRYRSAYASARAALDIWRHIGAQENEADALDTMARTLYDGSSRTSDALDLEQRARELFHHYGDPRGEADALDGMARLLRRMEQYTEAIAYAEQARGLRRMIGDARGEAESWDTLAHVYRTLGDAESDPRHYESARASAETGIAIAREIGDRFSEAALMSNHARVLLATGEIAEAETEAERAVHIGAKLEDPFGQAKRLENSALALRAAGKPGPAGERLRRARRLRDGLAESVPRE